VKGDFGFDVKEAHGGILFKNGIMSVDKKSGNG
jgi:hypothetical protein